MKKQTRLQPERARPPSRGRPWARALAVAAALAAPACPASTFVCYRIFPDAPPTQGDERRAFAGLSAPGEIRWDTNGIPHVSAATEEDGCRLAGYATARDRLWQLDLFRHAAQGRLAELVGNPAPADGPTPLQQDQMARFFGFQRRGREMWDETSGPGRACLIAYAGGVDAFVAEGPMPVELRMLEHRPEPWQPEDSIAIVNVLGLNLSHNFNRELFRLRLALERDLETVEEFWPMMIEDGQNTISPSVKTYPALPERYVAAVPEMREFLDAWRGGEPRPAPAIAPAAAGGGEESNNWVVAGRRTATGKPLLANDPHLPHLSPSLLYLIHIRAGPIRAFGATLPGLPYPLIGRNERVAWGATTNNIDIQDLFVEKPAGEKGFLSPQGPQAFGSRTETFHVKGGADVTVTARTTRHGVVLNDFHPAVPRGLPPIVLVQALDRARSPVHAARAMVLAANLEEWRAPLAELDFPAQNYVAADADGHIAYQSNGWVPKRARHAGTFPAPGWTGVDDWTERIPFDELPAAMDPPTGWLGTTNNQIVPPRGYPWPVLFDVAGPDRQRRLIALMDGERRFSFDDLRVMQTDAFDATTYWALADLRTLLAEAKLDATETKARDALAAWDGVAAVEGIAETIWSAWISRLNWDALGDECSPELMKSLFPMVQANVPWLTLWERPQSPLWDDRATPQKETRADIALRAFREAVAGLRKELGDGTATWTWGRVHQLTLRHAFHSRQSIAPFFDVGPFPHAGTPTSLLKGEFDHTEVLPGPIRNGPGTRFVMEPGGRTAAVLDGGNFGWPGTPGYGAMNAKWRAGELIDVPLTDDAVRAATALRVQAVPADRRSSR